MLVVLLFIERFLHAGTDSLASGIILVFQKKKSKFGDVEYLAGGHKPELT